MPEPDKGGKRIPMRRLPASEAVKSFAEVALGYSKAEAIAEARRAAGADLSAARHGCPFGVDVPELARLIANGEFEAAHAVTLKAHPWPGILGRYCHRGCEEHHTLGARESLFVSALERAAADHGEAGRPAFGAGAPTGRRVAILGAGSSGSAVAHGLRRHGHAVAIFDQLPIGGGMTAIGYPDFRLPQTVVQHDNALAEWGVETHFGVTINRALVSRLLAEYDAVVAATGKFKGARLDIPGEELDGVHLALDFLTCVKLDRPFMLGARVVVLGAGYSAQDASRTARRLGSEVNIYYRRSKDDMPVRATQLARYLTQQQAEGAPFVFQVAPVRIIGAGGKVTGVELVRTEPGAADESGRPAPVPVPGSEFIVPCDTVIAAAGEICDLSFLPHDIRMTEKGHVWTDPESFETSVARLYAVGEMAGANGTDGALRAGLTLAERLDRRLRQDRGSRRKR